MSYLQEFERELERKLVSNETGEDIVRRVSEKVLESYRNGIKAGQSPAPLSANHRHPCLRD